MIDLDRAPSLVDCDRVVATPEEGDGWWYGLAPWSRARAWLLETMGQRHAWQLETLPAPLDSLGSAVAYQHGLGAPVGALVHRNVELGYHTDTRNPVPCTNATVFYRDACDGGALILPERHLGFACDDGMLLIFDGQEPHGVTPLARSKTGARLSLTFYHPS